MYREMFLYVLHYTVSLNTAEQSASIADPPELMVNVCLYTMRLLTFVYM